jgi:hypothetical protein
MSATLKVNRDVSFGIELRRGRFLVLVDGSGIGAVEPHEVFEAQLAPGSHTLRIQAGRYSSHTHSFDAFDGETVDFRCHGTQIWPRYVVSIIKPNLAISLKRQ